MLRYRLFESADAESWYPVFLEWAYRLASRSNGRLVFEPARQTTPMLPPGGLPPKPTNASGHPLIDALYDGSADIVWFRPARVAGAFARVGAFELPFIASQAGPTSRALWEYAQAYAPAEFSGMRVLALHVHGRAQLHHEPLEGADPLCLRPLVTESAMVARLLVALDCPRPGLLPEGLPFEAMKAAGLLAVPYGALDSFARQGNFIVGPELIHVETAADQPALGTLVYALAMTPARFDALPPDVRALIEAESGPDASAWFGDRMAASNAMARRRLVGQQIRRTTVNEQARLRSAGGAVEARWLAMMKTLGHDGQQLLDGARTLIRQHTR